MVNNKLKTWLTALFCVVRCILFPKTKICIASATRPQANEVLLKITDDFMKNYGFGSENLRREITYAAVGANKAVIEFANGSWIRVVTASDSGRGSRANILLVDEFRMVDLDTINTVLRRFLTAPRQPNYLNNPKYAHLLERNKEFYMSSAWYKNHWSFEKAKAYLEKQEMPIVLKADGASIYATRDLAAIMYRARNYNFNKVNNFILDNYSQIMDAVKELSKQVEEFTPKYLYLPISFTILT